MGHDHDHAHTAAGKNHRRLVLVLAFTGVYLLVEVVGAWLTHSHALLAEAGHMLTDAGGLAAALVAIRIAERRATPEQTFGFYRAEILAALLNAMVLIGLSGFVLFEAVQRLRNPPEVHSQGMLAVAVVGLGVTLGGLIALRGGASQSLNLKSAYYEVLSDALTAVGVIIAAVVIWTTGWYYVDPLISAAIGLFILPRTWRLLREAVRILLEGTPADVNLAVLRDALEELAGVSAVHDLHVWALTSGMNAMSLHAVLEDGASHEAVLAAVRQRAVSGFKIAHVTVQVESKTCAAGEAHL
jgi:cobalt-zinc-cadmium efflux system protein